MPALSGFTAQPLSPISRRIGTKGRMGIGARIRQAREKRGLSQAGLAAAARVRQPSVAQWEAERTEPTRPTLRRVADVLGVTPHFLEFGQAGERFDANPHAMNANAMLRSLAVFGTKHDSLTAAGEAFVFEFESAVDYVKRPIALANAKHAYALYLPDGSMAPWRRHGQLIYVNPARPAACDDHVVIRLNPDHSGELARGLVKLLVKTTAHDLTLHQYSPPDDIVLPRERILGIHRIVDWEELLQAQS